MKRKLLVLLMVVFCGIFVFAACGDDAEEADSGNTQYYADGEEPVYTETVDRSDPKYYDEDGNYIGGYEEETVDRSDPKYYDEDGNYIGPTE